MADALVRSWKDQPLYRAAEDGYFNANQMCLACGTKRFCEYERTKRAQNYMAELTKALSLDQEFVCVNRAGSTWIHPRLAIDLARWLSPEFAVWIDGWVWDTLTNDSTSPSTARNPRQFLHQKQIINETDLHYAIVAWVRRFFPRAIIAPGLGELQDTEEKRIDAWKKGYTGGQPDILILDRHQQYSGLALELKHPGKRDMDISDNQIKFLERLRWENWRVITSNDYDEICFEIGAYMRDLALKCSHCTMSFATKRARDQHHDQEHGGTKKRKRRQEPTEDPTEKTT